MFRHTSKFRQPLGLELGVRWWCGLLLILNFLGQIDLPADSPTAPPATNDWIFEATNHLGQWIWDTTTADKQTCLFWRSFKIPERAQVTSAKLRITVDNGYLLYLDGREVGRGSDWRTVTEYDVTRLLSSGWHVVAVEGFNDRLEAGLIFSLHVELLNQKALDLVSDESWLVATNTQRNWATQKTALPGWHAAIVVGGINHAPWEKWPFGLTVEPQLLPIVTHFWQAAWFQLTILALLLAALASCLWLWLLLSSQARSQQLLQAERIRIARDIHDDLGGQVTELILLGEVARREHADYAPAREQFSRFCTAVRELSRGVDEVIWAVNARRDTLRDFVSYVCTYAKKFLESTSIGCRLDVEKDLPSEVFDLPLRRNLFLAVKEALNNAAKHSQATELFLRIHRAGDRLVVAVEDNGRGFDSAQSNEHRNGLVNLAQRMEAVGGACEVVSAPGAGCCVRLIVPLGRTRRQRWLGRR